MTASSTICMFVLVALATVGCVTNRSGRDPGIAAEARAIEFLKREVPAWSRDNGCYSCHNNGDAARALYAATRAGYYVSQKVLADTSAWVARPERWIHNKGDPGFSDQRLADLQFAASLASAAESGAVKDDLALKAAARKVALGQADDGSWPIDEANAAGSPATYGAALATFMAWDFLKRVPSTETSVSIRKAEEKLNVVKADSVPNAAVRLLFLANHDESSTAKSSSRLRRTLGHEAETESSAKSPDLGFTDRIPEAIKPSLDFLRRAQTSDGGWGPYADSPPEAFDTALALLALAEYRASAGISQMIARGRRHLVAGQLLDGNWPATTRPSGGQSYAQQMSTTAWVTLALLATR